VRGWILFHRDLDPAIPEAPEIFRFQEAAQALAIDLPIFKPHDFDIVVGGGDEWALTCRGDAVERPDFVICRTGAESDYPTLALLRHLERRGVRMINGSQTIELVADKLHTLQNLAQAGLPIPRTILGNFPIDSGLVGAHLGFPLIVKTLKGTRGAGVLKCEDRTQFEDLAGLLASAGTDTEFILQHYIRASHGRDVRVLVVGGRAVTAMERRSLTGGFKSNVSLGGIGAAFNPPPEMADLAVRTAEALGLEIAGIDILFDEEGYRICEANSAPGFQGLERATGVDVPGTILRWIVATHGEGGNDRPEVESDALIRMIFGSRTGLRQLADRAAGFRGFAAAVGWRATIAGLGALAHATLPPLLANRRGATGARLHALYDTRLTLGGMDPSSEERTLLIVLGVSIWAAVLPWLAGAETIFAGTLSLLALGYPATFLLATSVRPRARTRE